MCAKNWAGKKSGYGRGQGRSSQDMGEARAAALRIWDMGWSSQERCCQADGQSQGQNATARISYSVPLTEKELMKTPTTLSLSENGASRPLGLQNL